MEDIPHGLAIQQKILLQVQGCLPDGFRNPALQAAPVDPGDGAAPLQQHQATAIQLLLHEKVAICQEAFRLLHGDRIEQLGTDPRVLRSCRAGVGHSVSSGCITLRGLLAHQLVVNPLGLVETDRLLRLGARGQGRAPSPVGESDHPSPGLLFQARLIDFIRRAFSIIQRDAVHDIFPFCLIVKVWRHRCPQPRALHPPLANYDPADQSDGCDRDWDHQGGDCFYGDGQSQDDEEANHDTCHEGLFHEGRLPEELAEDQNEGDEHRGDAE